MDIAADDGRVFTLDAETAGPARWKGAVVNMGDTNTSARWLAVGKSVRSRTGVVRAPVFSFRGSFPSLW